MPTWEEIKRGLPKKARDMCNLAINYNKKKEDLRETGEEEIIMPKTTSLLIEISRIVNRLENLYMSTLREYFNKSRLGNEEALENIIDDIRERRKSIRSAFEDLPTVVQKGGRPALSRQTSIVLSEFGMFISNLKNVMITTKRKWAKEQKPPIEKDKKIIAKRFNDRLKYFNDVSKILLKYARGYGYKKDREFLKRIENQILKKYRTYVGKYVTQAEEDRIHKKYKSVKTLVDKNISEEVVEYDIQIPEHSIIKDTETSFLNYVDSIEKQDIIFSVKRLKNVLGGLESKYDEETIKNAIFRMREQLRNSFWEKFLLVALRSGGLVPPKIIRMEGG